MFKSSIERLLKTYAARPVILSDAEIATRIKDINNALGSGRLSGAPDLQGTALASLELYQKGQINKEEYLHLCKLSLGEARLSTDPANSSPEH
jgi:hypothetical protein